HKRRNAIRQMRKMSSASSVSMTVRGGAIMDGFYRDASERSAKGGRSQHLGIDISLPKGGDGSYNDPRRGTPVYIAINPIIKISELNAVRAYDKANSKNLSGLGIAGTGDAELTEGIIRVQPWEPKDGDSYGGIVGVACHYKYNKTSGGTGEFTLYVEYLHLITEKYLAKNSAGKIATPDEWKATGKPYGFGKGINNNDKWDKAAFLGPTLAVAGYLGATQTPHVHVQCAYETGKVNYSFNTRVDPEIIIY
ncbi:MAG TPA: hypothetical protein VEB42_06500, partial [Chitinophagaceae bacterium]|nr:hypothetical protein [Chitinophagaceae bacterium]